MEEEVKMGEGNNAMRYDQDMIFRHLCVRSRPLPSLHLDIESLQVLLHRLTFQRSSERNADQAKLEE